MNAAAPERFHALTRAERDHLVAVADTNLTQPSGRGVQRRVGSLRGEQQPTDETTYGVLGRLDEWGFVEKRDIDGRTTGYEVTEDGLELLSQAVAVNPA